MYTFRPAALDEIFALRHSELRPGRPAATARFDGDDAPTTRHFGAFTHAGVCDGCVTLVHVPWHDQPALQLRGMATRGTRVRQGIGRQLLATATAAVWHEFGPLPLWCSARVSAIPFYAQAGWTVMSAAFDVPDVGPHVHMSRRA